MAASFGYSFAQTLADHSIGEQRSSLEKFVKGSWKDTYGNYQDGSFQTSNGVRLTGTTDKSTGKVVRLEAKADKQTSKQPAYFSDFKFGETTLATIRQRFGNAGSLPGNGLPVLTTSDGGLEISSFYEVADSDVVVMFVTKISQKALLELKKRYGASAYDHMAKVAFLDSVALSKAAYFQETRGTPSVFDIGYQPIAWQPATIQTADQKRQISLARIKPSQLPVARVYSGPSNAPDFTDQSATTRNYRTRIVEGMASGPNFAGEFAVVEINCGTNCTNVFVGNVRTGEVFKLPVGGASNTNLALKFDLSSRLMTTQWAHADTGTCVIQFFSFNDGEWIELLRHDLGDKQQCLTSLSQNLR
ncbi:hypothetical protein [Agrobacterium sp. Azo12]|uniref:hypothetical protein n=1 Tax=Agrobacterium sp. Azo12 TaxID=3031129 RepID=UPI0023D84286|nr:hypothetical protein [Agrobacterium sp. Azo12]MDO5897281.1 hypothetical protein [Agrobacterium sp. Azo12]